MTRRCSSAFSGGACPSAHFCLATISSRGMLSTCVPVIERMAFFSLPMDLMYSRRRTA